MKKHLIHFLLVAVLSVCSAAAFAQTTVKGQLVDSETGEPLVGAAVMVEGTSQGTVTDIDGYFKQGVAQGGTLVFKYVGFKDLKKKITQKGASVDLGAIQMEPDAVMLKDVVITSSVAVARKTPVALSTVDPTFIEEKLGTQEFPEILKSTPGVHANKQGGGYGDSEIYMRGFGQENVAVMVNGVPVNDMEWGGVYWSNWAGLSDVTRTLQTQRGLGASKVSAPSVGGTINIVTRGLESKKGGSISYAMGNDGMNKIQFNVSTGLTKNGWALTLLGAKHWGDGYVQGTKFEGYNYFINLAKRINDNHQLQFMATGAPQHHDQRDKGAGLTIADWEMTKRTYGVADNKYNPSFGYRKNGEAYNANHNFYHKPQISLNHQWEIDRKSSLSTSLYMSLGRGGGYSGQGNDKFSPYSYSSWNGAYKGALNTTFRRPDGTFDYAAIEDYNASSEYGSALVMSESKNEHVWYGLLSTYTTKLGENFDFYGGVDFRYYKGTHTNVISDLFGGEYYMDNADRLKVKAANNAAAADPMWAYQKLYVGDVVYRDYDGYVMQEGAFFQLEYNKDKLAAFVSGSLSNTGYWRVDRFYYDKEHEKSETVNFLGFTAKGGANYNLTENHNVFFNVGAISRAPKFSYGAFMQATSSNATNPNAVNEKIFSAELGYGFRNRMLTANVNLYYTKWMDKTMTTGTDLGYTRANINMSGVEATHMGAELDLKFKPFNWMELTGMFSYGDWKWGSNAKGYFFSEQGGQPLDKNGNVTELLGPDHAWAIINMDGVRVGGSAQTTAAVGLNVNVNKDIRVGADWTYYGRNYSYYQVDGTLLSINKENTLDDPWKIPAASMIDLNASWKFKIGALDAVFSGNVNNLLNYQYIEKAWNPKGKVATDENVYVFYTLGRTYSLRLRVNF